MLSNSWTPMIWNSNVMIFYPVAGRRVCSSKQCGAMPTTDHQHSNQQGGTYRRMSHCVARWRVAVWSYGLLEFQTQGL